ncbi:Cell division protein FtsB [Limimonas halophila]|uniref:Cell division protein FtsB n=1 Tax=Limimonas halophila TaxID=1082479 RepID=A0A1G7NBR1_9PROT|nr:septum formation initiator family protein [Limimonas halophila]SDF71337.1 Cell division protein FtsB [Limimonas halophila]
MAGARDILRRARPLAPHLAVAGVIAFFLLHALHGRGGLLAYVHLQDRLAAAKQTRAELVEQRERLAHRIELLKPGTLNPDMLEEQARRVLNFARPDEVVVLLDHGDPAGGGEQP